MRGQQQQQQQHGIRVGDVVGVKVLGAGGERKWEKRRAALEASGVAGVDGVVVRVWGRGVAVAVDADASKGEDLGLGAELGSGNAERLWM